MPQLPDPDLPINAPSVMATFNPARPSPSQDMLGLERMSNRELMWWGQRFGIDTPYYFVFLGWGEVEPVIG